MKKILFILPALVLFSCGETSTSSDPGASSTPAEVTDDCKAVLKKMSDKLAGANTLKVTGNRSIDPTLIGEGVAKEEAEVVMTIERPANIFAQSKDKNSVRELHFNGKRVVVTDETEVGLFHAGADVEAESIKAFSAKLIERFGYQPPLTEFFTDDPYQLLLEDVESGKVVGDEDVAGENCDHLSFTQEGISWDLWVSKADSLPKKFVLTFLEIDGSPKIEAELSKWELNPDVSGVAFSWEAPEGAIEIDIVSEDADVTEAPAE